MKDNKYAIGFSLITFIAFIVLDIYSLFTTDSIWAMVLSGLSLVIFSMLLILVGQAFWENKKK